MKGTTLHTHETLAMQATKGLAIKEVAMLQALFKSPHANTIQFKVSDGPDNGMLYRTGQVTQVPTRGLSCFSRRSLHK